MIKIKYDKSADVAYIYLIPENQITPGWVKKTISADPQQVNGMINLDFDQNGCLGGIEILDASKKLSQEI